MEILGQKSYACWYCSPVVVKRRRNDPQVLCLNRSASASASGDPVSLSSGKRFLRRTSDAFPSHQGLIRLLLKQSFGSNTGRSNRMSHLHFYDARSPHLKVDPLAYPPGEDDFSTHTHLLLIEERYSSWIKTFQMPTKVLLAFGRSDRSQRLPGLFATRC